MSFFWVFIGGGIGSLCRYGISRAVPPNSATTFPWATFWANLLACLALGLVLGWLSKQQVDDKTTIIRSLFVSGFCGGFSTFSTFSFESLQLIKQQQWAIAAAYIGLSFILGILLVFVGYLLSK